MTVIRSLGIALLCMLTLPAGAAGMARVADFYQGQAPLESRAQAARPAAIREALAEVLVRLTGDVSISLRDGAQPILGEADRYVRSFRYAELPAEATPDQPPEESAEPRLALIAEFDAAALKAAVKRQGLPLWAERRPVTLLWLAASALELPRQLLGREQVAELAPELLEVSRDRGLPLNFPVLDEVDRAAFGYADVIREERERALAASQRYAPRHVLLAHLDRRGQAWFAGWSLLQEDGSVQRWESRGETPGSALAGGFTRYADDLATRYALEVSPGWVQATQLRVLGVAALADYARVLEYLQGLELVDSAEPVAVQGDELLLALTYEGEREDLERSIRQGDVLRRAVEAEPETVNLGAPAAADEAADSGPSFFAVSAQRELRYRLAR